MVASAPLVPTFVQVRAAKGYERRNRGTSPSPAANLAATELPDALHLLGRSSQRSRGHDVGEGDAVVLGPHIAEPMAHIAPQHERIGGGLAALLLVGDEGEIRHGG